MYHSPAHVILQHLVDEALVTASGEWQGFVAWTPDDGDVHDNIVSVNDTGGVADGRNLRTGEHFEHPGIQCYVRSRTHSEGHRKAHFIATALDDILRTVVTLEGHTYLIQAAKKRPTLYLGREQDGRQRYRFSVNATLTIEETL